MNDGKVNDESLAELSGIHSNKMYLYGIKFTLVVSLNRQLHFKNQTIKNPQIYEPGTTTPADYGSQHPPPAHLYSAKGRSQLGIEEEDAEIIANGVDEVTDAVTNHILGQHTHKDKTVALLLEDIK